MHSHGRENQRSEGTRMNPMYHTGQGFSARKSLCGPMHPLWNQEPEIPDSHAPASAGSSSPFGCRGGGHRIYLRRTAKFHHAMSEFPPGTKRAVCVEENGWAVFPEGTRRVAGAWSVATPPVTDPKRALTLKG